MHIEEELKSCFNDYEICVIDVCYLSDEELEMMNSDFKSIFRLLRDENTGVIRPESLKDRLLHEKESLDLITTCLGDDTIENAYKEVKRERGDLTMCEALEKLINQGRTDVIRDMLKRGKSVEDIMEFTGYSKAQIEEAKAGIVSMAEA